MTNTIQELELIKRTAWMNANRAPRQDTQEEADRITPFVINAIVYCAALNGLLYDFEDAVKADKTNNDCVKKVLRMLHHKAQYAHGEIYRVFNNEINGFGKLYNERYDLTMQAIEKHVGWREARGTTTSCWRCFDSSRRTTTLAEDSGSLRWSIYTPTSVG